MAASRGDENCTTTLRPVRHPHLYLEHEGGTAIFLVEQTLFKIHEYFLKHHSIVFASMFTLTPGSALVEGKSDELPISLPDVRADDFARLLYLFYPRDVVSGDVKTVDDWTSVLRLAHRYDLDAHRQLAVARLDQLASPIDRILLARQYDIPGWLEQAYFALCMREESLTIDEGGLLDMADVIYISDLRLRARAPQGDIQVHERYLRWMISQRLGTPPPQ